jgi:hypothetical protein
MIDLEIKSFILDFRERFKQCLLKHELYGIEDFDLLLQSINLIADTMLEREDLFIPVQEHKLDKFGLSEMAVRFANVGKSHREIAETISTAGGVSITEKEVKEWFETYSNLKMVKKKKTYGNVFAIQERMQDIYSQLMEHLDGVKETENEEFWKGKTTKQQVILDIYKEVRYLTKDATDILKSINHQQQLEQFKMLVLETIRKIDPGTARIIIEKLEQDKALFNAILPPDF